MSSAKPSDTAVTISVAKSDVQGLLGGAGVGGGGAGVDGEFPWPIPARSLFTLYKSSAEHSRAIHVKAEGAFGGGLIGDTTAIDALCDTGTTELFTQLGLDLETYGNAFLQVVRGGGDRILKLRRLPAVTMHKTKSGFVQTVTTAGGSEKKIKFSNREIVHLRELCPSGGHYAEPTWIGAAGMLELAHAATRFNASFFANNAIPEHAVIFKGMSPSPAQTEQIRSFFRNEYQGLDNAHRTLVLTTPEDGQVEIKKLTADLKDGDFLKLLDAARDRIPIAHGTPPRILGIMSAGQLGGGGEVSGQLFIFEHLTLKPKRRRMLDQLRPLLRELGLEPGDPADLATGQVAFRPLDLTPPGEDAANVPALVQSGIITAEEARALMPALTGLAGDTPQGDAEPPTEPVARSAPQTHLQALTALLARS